MVSQEVKQRSTSGDGQSSKGFKPRSPSTISIDFHGLDQILRVGSDQRDFTLTREIPKPPDPTRADPEDFQHPITHPDPTREVEHFLTRPVARVITSEKALITSLQLTISPM